MWFPNPRQVTYFLSWLLIIAVVIAGGYLLFININALRYNPENVVRQFVTLIENPTQTVTEEEKKILGEITQSGFLQNWGNENNLKTLRRVSQQKPVKIGTIEYLGNQRYAKVKLTFDNDFNNPKSKEATLYLEKYGDWWQNGIRWRIYQIDMPQEDNVLDNIKDQADKTKQEVDQNTQNLLDTIRDLFGGNQNNQENKPQKEGN